MRKSFKKTKKVTIDNLAVMVAKGFDGIEKDIGELKKDIGEVKNDVGELKKDMGEVKGNVKNIRKDVLNLGDRFPSQFSFDQLSNRVYNLDKKIISKK